jgi:hypothetical protein
MSKESTKAAFQKAFSTHMLLNLSPEEEDSLTAYEKSDERIRMEQQSRSKTQPSPPTQQQDSI